MAKKPKVVTVDAAHVIIDPSIYRRTFRGIYKIGGWYRNVYRVGGQRVVGRGRWKTRKNAELLRCWGAR